MSDPTEWTVEQTCVWLAKNDLTQYQKLFTEHSINGKALLALTENDIRQPPLGITSLGDIKKIGINIENLKEKRKQPKKTLVRYNEIHSYVPQGIVNDQTKINVQSSESFVTRDVSERHNDAMCCVSGLSLESECRKQFCNINPELARTLLLYIVFNFVIFIECVFVVLATHRVPDRKDYPPLPDIFLDNVPYTEWCADASEVIILSMGAFCFVMALLHKQR